MRTYLFLGVGGAGMKGLAYLMQQNGECIYGYDDNPSLTSHQLPQALRLVPCIDALIYTDAARKDHPLRIESAKHGIPEVAYHVALGEFSRPYQTIAITGTHGKSSTTAFLAHIMIEQGLDPTVLVGANMPKLPGGHARKGNGKYFIVEADEYRRHFLELNPQYIVITSIDYDHPDAFSSIADVENAYSEFIKQLQPGGFVIVPEHEYNAHENIAWPPRTTLVPASARKNIQVPLPGVHMRTNASLAVKVGEILGIDELHSTESLVSFPGLARRFELIGNLGAIDIRSDYGHHPAEIAATLLGAKEFSPNAHIIAIFEAHMPQRLHTFFEDFVTALALADEVIITPPFIPEGRSTASSLKDAKNLKDSIENQHTDAMLAFTDEELMDHLTKHAKKAHKPALAILFSAGTLDARIRKLVNNR